MYYIRTPNGLEEGPLTEAQVAERIHTRRLAPSTLLRGPNTPQPKPVTDFPEFAAQLRQYAEMTAILEAPRRSRLAITCLAFGVVSLLAAVLAFAVGSRVQQRVIQEEQQRRALQAEQTRLAREQALIQRKHGPKSEENSRPANPRPSRPDPSRRELPPGNPLSESPTPGSSSPSPSPSLSTPTPIDITKGPSPSPSQKPNPALPAGASTVLISSALSLVSLLTCIVLGTVALVRIRKPSNRLTGNHFAIGGLSCAGAMLLVVGFGTWNLMSQIPTQQIRRYAAYEGRQRALTQLHQLATADGKAYPAPEKWCDVLQPLLPPKSEILGTPKTGSRYGYNFRVEGKRPKEIARDTVIFCELRKPGWNSVGSPETVKRPGDLEERVVVVLANGRALLVDAMEVDGLRWEP